MSEAGGSREGSQDRSVEGRGVAVPVRTWNTDPQSFDAGGDALHAEVLRLAPPAAPPVTSGWGVVRSVLTSSPSLDDGVELS